MKYLIFGGTGFVGKNLLNFIESKGEKAAGVSRSGKDNSLAIDITDSNQFSKINFKPDVIVNCASRIPVSGKSSCDPEFLNELLATNILGSVNIANWAKKMKIPKIINCSTLVVQKKPWPDPLSEEFSGLPVGPHVGYGMSKLAQEQLMTECVADSETKVLHLRLSAVFGRGMTQEGIIFRMLKTFLLNQDLILTDATKNTLDFIHVNDVCKSIYAIAKLDFHNEILNVASGEPISILELAEFLKKATNSQSQIINNFTNKSGSFSNIEINKLKNYIGEIVDDFSSVEEGMKQIAEDFKV